MHAIVNSSSLCFKVEHVMMSIELLHGWVPDMVAASFMIHFTLHSVESPCYQSARGTMKKISKKMCCDT